MKRNRVLKISRYGSSDTQSLLQRCEDASRNVSMNEKKTVTMKQEENRKNNKYENEPSQSKNAEAVSSLCVGVQAFNHVDYGQL